MQIAQKSERHPEAILTLRQATIVFVVLAIVTADTVAILGVLGMMTMWEAAVALFAVLALAAGAMWTLLLVPHRGTPQPDQGGSSEGSASQDRL
jgi:hypothetical protein